MSCYSTDISKEEAATKADKMAEASLASFLKSYNGKEVMQFIRSNHKKVKLRLKEFSKTVGQTETGFQIRYRHRQMLNLHGFPESFCISVPVNGDAPTLDRKGHCGK